MQQRSAHRQTSSGMMHENSCFVKLLFPRCEANQIISIIANFVPKAYIAQCTTDVHPGTDSCPVLITGRLTHVLAAYTAFVEFGISTGRKPADPQLTDIVKVKFIVPDSGVSRIIGRGGSSIRELQRSLGGRVQVSQRDFNTSERVVLITGSQPAVVDTGQAIIVLLQTDPHMKEHLQNNLSQLGGSPSSALTSPSSALSTPIKTKVKRGFEITSDDLKALSTEELQRQTGAQVTLSRSNSKSYILYLEGSTDDVTEGQKFLEKSIGNRFIVIPN